MDKSTWSLEKRVINLEKTAIRQRGVIKRLYQKLYARTENTRLRSALMRAKSNTIARAAKINRLVGTAALHRLSLQLSGTKRYKNKSVMFLSKKERMKLFLFLNTDYRSLNSGRKPKVPEVSEG